MRVIILFFFALSQVMMNAQELFPNNEPASTMPKGVFGVRQFNELYKELSTYRSLNGIRVSYGAISKLTLMASLSMSNHHDVNFPNNLVSHTHLGSQTIYKTGEFQRGVPYRFKYNGVYLYAKYRFFSNDGEHKHFRLAAYADWSNVDVAHDESEPTLLEDTKGFGVGCIATVLQHRFAASFTGGLVRAGKYNGFAFDTIDGALISTEIKYGNALLYNLSFGYLLLPLHYKNYKQTNVNVYLEFQGKSYGQANVTQYGGVVDVPIMTPLLKAGHYVEVYPGLQMIFNSNFRADLSVGFPLINFSYARFYPLTRLAIQRYFYSKKKS